MAMKQSQKTLALWAIIVLLSVSVLHFLNTKPTLRKPLSYSEFMAAAQNGEIESVVIQEDRYLGKFKNRDSEAALFETIGPGPSEKVLELLAVHGVKVEFKQREEAPIWQQILISWMPMVLLFLFFFFSMRQIQIGGGKALAFGKSKARLLTENQRKVTFKDAAGIDEAKEELEEIIEFLREPKKFTRLGGRIPKGVLLVGPPGTGKTLLARAVAGEAGVPFFSISGSDFVEMFVGVGASRVRDLFEQGKKNAPCIVFIDEIDAVGRHRGAGMGGGHDEREQTLNQLLVEMDGFESNEGVFIMAATNRPDVLVPALLRPGRFDRRVMVPRPDVKGREEILKVHTRNKLLAPNVDLSVLARGTPGFVGADLENLVNEAALHAARYNQKSIGGNDFDVAKDKVLMGAERRSMIISEEEKKNTAYHEAGHTLVARMVPGTDPIHKVSIIPRGAALGATQQLPIDDRHTQSKKYVEGMIAVMMGGRCAEELIFNEPTTGAQNDIQRASELARKMVCDWGMSSKMGPMSFGQHDQEVFLGRDFLRQKEYSEETARQIDAEVSRIVNEQYLRAQKVLQENVGKLHQLAKALLEFESLDSNQVEQVLRGEKLEPTVRGPRGGQPPPEPAVEPATMGLHPLPHPGKA